MMIPLVVILGPTASGKTALAIEVALKTGGEIISADSMQVYRGMDIGTAKPDISERRGVKHHLIDVAEPEENFSAGRFAAMAHRAIKEVHQKGKIPILAGGTGLYIDIVTQNTYLSDAASDEGLRARLALAAKTSGREALYNELREKDPVAAAKLHVNDVKRVIRALEIYYLTGRCKTRWDIDSQRAEKIYDCLYLGLETDRKVLYNRINLRVDRMVADGLFREAEALYGRLKGKKTTSMQGLGYKEIVYYLNGLATKDEAVDIIKKNTRRFAKRQMTWFRKNNNIIWLDTAEGTGRLLETALRLIGEKGMA